MGRKFISGSLVGYTVSYVRRFLFELRLGNRGYDLANFGSASPVVYY